MTTYYDYHYLVFWVPWFYVVGVYCLMYLSRNNPRYKLPAYFLTIIGLTFSSVFIPAKMIPEPWLMAVFFNLIFQNGMLALPLPWAK
jgi:hypothetical protein